MNLRLAGTALAALTLLAGCSRAATTPVTPRAAAAPVAAGLRITPEQAEEKAKKKAREWQADATLIGAVWAVPKLELAGISYHLFRAANADGLLIVESRMTTFWQKVHPLNDKRLAIAAKALDPLGRPAIDAKHALEIAKAQRLLEAEGDDKPLALLALADARLAPPLWGAQAGTKRVLIHAETGQVLLGGGSAVELVMEAVRKLPKPE